MASIEPAPEVFDDFERFFDYIAEFDVGAVPARMEEILQAVQILATSPLIGRSVKGGKRELVIGRGSRGCVALYRYVPEVDTVFLLAIRSQRESVTSMTREPGFRRASRSAASGHFRTLRATA